jgi:uncharacterized protein YkwD
MGIGSPLLRRSAEARALPWHAGTHGARRRARDVAVPSNRRRTQVAATFLCALAVFIAGASGAAAAPRAPAATLSQLEANVLVDINAFRTQHGLARLTLSAALTSAARAHTRQMAQDGYFAHNSADGSAFWRRLQSFYPSSSYRYWSVGENLLWESPAVNGSQALRLWLESPQHRENLANPNWREIGVSALHVTQAPGIYHGLDVTIVTTDFGVRR